MNMVPHIASIVIDIISAVLCYCRSSCVDRKRNTLI